MLTVFIIEIVKVSKLLKVYNKDISTIANDSCSLKQLIETTI